MERHYLVRAMIQDGERQYEEFYIISARNKDFAKEQAQSDIEQFDGSPEIEIRLINISFINRNEEKILNKFCVV